MRRSHILTALAIMSLGSAAPAVILDASCVGVQAVAALDRFNGLKAAEQEQYRPVIDRINALGQQVAASLAEPERQLRELFSQVSADMPGATQEQLSDAVFRKVTRSVEVDNIFTQSLQTEAGYHDAEALMVAAASQLPRPGAAERTDSATLRHVERHDPTLAPLIQNSLAMRHLYRMRVVADKLGERALSEPLSQALAADALAASSDKSQVGFDTDKELPEVDFRALPDLTPRLVEAQAIGTRATLVGTGLRRRLPSAELRSQLMRPGATQTGRVSVAQQAVSNTDMIVALDALRTATQSVPKKPPPANAEARRAWARQTVDRLKRADDGMRRKMEGFCTRKTPESPLRCFP